jgi:LytS/YehU family sensor histidine kinase
MACSPSSRDALPRRRAYGGWIAYAAAWLAAAGLWSLASSVSARVSPLVALPYGLMTMAMAGVMGVFVWHLTARLPWRSPRIRFYAIHAIALGMYASLYTITMVLPDLIRGDLTAAMSGLRASPVLVWSLLMGSWLYLIIAGLSYAIRSDQERDREAAAATEARLLAQNAQLTALRAQLNPHFLFNALHTVSALIPHDPAGADLAIERLGELLRYAMSDDDLVPLSSEWRFVLDYLAFEQLRLGERLHVVDHLDPAAADRLVPPLLLQPVVENAVRHGIAARPNGGRIDVEARIDGDATILRVADNGPGGNDRDGGRQGLGLTSVRRRLAAVFGPIADLRVAATGPNGGYEVLMRIPEHDG